MSSIDSSRTANLAAQLEHLAADNHWFARPAFHGPETSWSHEEVHRGGEAAAAFLSAAGVRPGDRVLVAASDRVELVWALLGTLRAGATAILVNPLLAPGDHAFMVSDSNPAVVLCDGSLTARFSAWSPTAPIDELNTAPHIGFSPIDVAAEIPAYGQYTSGTTGSPKAALHRHTDPLGYHAAMGAGVLALCPDDVVYSISKAYFAYGLGNSIFFPLLSGCSAVLDPARPTVDHVATETAKHRATVLFAVPSFYARLVADAEASQFASIRLAVCAGETLQPVLYERACSWLGREVLDGLGSTEVGQTFISNTPGRSRAGSIGTVLDGYEAVVRDESGRPALPGQVGALWVRGDTVMVGYLNRPEETAATLVDGWCRTGDRASVDDDGYFHHHGRTDDLEIVGGINISPQEVEAVLLEHPAVVEVAVAAVPDHDGATRLRCFAVLDGVSSWSPLLEGEMLTLARAQLAAYKVPRSVVVVDALPRTPTGKLRRHVLRSGWPSE